MAKETKTICFVVPEYREDTPTHFNHVYDLIRAASTLMNIYVYIEKISGTADLPGAQKVFVAKRKNVFLNFLESIKLFFRLQKSGVTDFYVHYSFRAAFAAALITKLFGGKVLYWNCGEPWKYKRNFFREQFERGVYRMIDYLVTGTESLKKKYAEIYGISEHKIKVMPNWIDLQKFSISNFQFSIQDLRNQLHIADNGKIILFVHRLSQRKGAQYLPEIVKAFKDKNVVFVIIGDGPEKQNLELSIKNLGLYNQVRLLGSVPNERIAPYYALADVFVMPSDEEGFPRVLLEAMAMEKPFVAFAVGGVKEITPPELRIFVVEAGDVETFVKQLEAVLTTDVHQGALLQSSERQWVQRFSVEKVVDIFVGLFR